MYPPHPSVPRGDRRVKGPIIFLPPPFFLDVRAAAQLPSPSLFVEIEPGQRGVFSPPFFCLRGEQADEDKFFFLGAEACWPQGFYFLFFFSFQKVKRLWVPFRYRGKVVVKSRTFPHPFFHLLDEDEECCTEDGEFFSPLHLEGSAKMVV